MPDFDVTKLQRVFLVLIPWILPALVIVILSFFSLCSSVK